MWQTNHKKAGYIHPVNAAYITCGVVCTVMTYASLRIAAVRVPVTLTRNACDVRPSIRCAACVPLGALLTKAPLVLWWTVTKLYIERILW